MTSRIPPLLTLLTLLMATTSAFAGESERCRDIRQVRALANKHNLADDNLRALEALYCGRGRPATRPTAKAAKKECAQLQMMVGFARASGGLGASKLKMIRSERDLACGSGLTRKKKTWYWPNNRTARTSSGTWYYPNGNMARTSSGTHYYPNGNMARTSSGTWYYPNGNMSRTSSGTWYTPSGNRVSGARGLMAWTCQRVGAQECRKMSKRYGRVEGKRAQRAMLVRWAMRAAKAKN